MTLTVDIRHIWLNTWRHMQQLTAHAASCRSSHPQTKAQIHSEAKSSGHSKLWDPRKVLEVQAQLQSSQGRVRCHRLHLNMGCDDSTFGLNTLNAEEAACTSSGGGGRSWR